MGWSRWVNAQTLQADKYQCGHCDTLMSTDEGYVHPGSVGVSGFDGEIRICSNCHLPTFFGDQCGRSPGALFGKEVKNLPENVAAIYREARLCTGAGAHTASVLACRKLLMHIAVNKGAKEGKSFQSYVEYLADKGYIPPDGRAWVDHVRKKSNEQNHEIVMAEAADSEQLIKFLGMLLTIMYEFPAEIPGVGDPDGE